VGTFTLVEGAAIGLDRSKRIARGILVGTFIVVGSATLLALAFVVLVGIWMMLLLLLTLVFN
jgi:hypothetical protein